ncbi:alpha/beta fold hydrolase [Inhella sp.]|uniref:alpha/beta fold hydrolase n=1 Tax=Inhella sp. TaxID=1921806 RepID=UPI0035B4C462
MPHRPLNWLSQIFATTALLAASWSAGASPASELQVQVRGDGRPVLFVHGLNSAASTFEGTCAALQPGVQCHLVQLPGFAGAAPLAEPKAYVQQLSQQLQAYTERAGLKDLTVVGHSLGGSLALNWAAERPEQIARLVIVDTLPFLMALRNPQATAQEAGATAAAMREGVRRGPLPRPHLEAMARSMTRTAEGQQRLVAWGEASDPASTAEAMHDLWALDLRPLLARVQAPTRVLASWAAYAPMGGTAERVRGLNEAQYAGLRGVQIEVSAAGYHFLMWDDPTLVEAQVRAALQ